MWRPWVVLTCSLGLACSGASPSGEPALRSSERETIIAAPQPAAAPEVPAPPAAPMPSARPAPAPPAPAPSTATIPDPRSCAPDEPRSPKAAWVQVPLPDRFEVATMGFAGGHLFVFGQDRSHKPLMIRVDPKARAAQQPAAAAPLVEGLTRPTWVQPVVRCIDGLLVFWGDANRHRAWGAIYDPARDTWRKISPYGAPASSTSGTDGKRLYVFEPGHEREISGAAFDPASDRWLPLPPGPAPGFDWLAEPMFVRGKLLLWGCRRGGRNECAGAVYDPVTGTWQRIAPPPIDLEGDGGVFRLFPLVLGDALVLLAPAHERPRSRSLRLGPDLRWTPGPMIAFSGDTEHHLAIGGRHQGYFWSGTWNARAAPRFRMQRLRLAPDLSITEVAKLSDPRALPRDSYPFLGELQMLQAADALFVTTRVYAETDAPDRALWIQR